MVGDPGMLDDDFGGNHPLDPLRWELTWLLAKSLGVIDSFEVFAPSPAGVETLGLIMPRATSMRSAAPREQASASPLGMGSAPRTLRFSRAFTRVRR